MRAFRDDDSVAELTALLHRAYAALATLGLRFVATYQDEATTLERIQEGECFVAELDGRVVGSIVFRDSAHTGGCDWYDRADVASFGQYGVEPSLQGCGIGSALLDFVENRAREAGAEELALDTAEPATHLIELYAKKGYRIVDHVKWDVVNYGIVILC
ncbi:MAG: hypothetical protein QOJ65_114 [Fimbriimonadaceae bacterium]|nr:hypothetical protein [Fimbriimonadaceae bacterium]